MRIFGMHVELRFEFFFFGPLRRCWFFFSGETKLRKNRKGMPEKSKRTAVQLTIEAVLGIDAIANAGLPPTPSSPITHDIVNDVQNVTWKRTRQAFRRMVHP